MNLFISVRSGEFRQHAVQIASSALSLAFHAFKRSLAGRGAAWPRPPTRPRAPRAIAGPLAAGKPRPWQGPCPRAMGRASEGAPRAWEPPPFCAPTVPLADRSRLPVWPVQVRPRRGRRGGSSRDRRHRPSGVTAGARTSRCASRPAKRPCARRRRWDSTPPRRRGAAAGDTRARAVARARRFPRLPVLRPPHRRHVCAAAERAHVRRPSPLPDVPPADCLWSREREP
jgi:hypothetical protein